MRTASVQPIASSRSEGRPALRLQQRVVRPRPGRIDVQIGRDDVVVAGEDDRHARGVQLGRVGDQPVEPGELVGEFRARAADCRSAGRCRRSARRRRPPRCSDSACRPDRRAARPAPGSAVVSLPGSRRRSSFAVRARPRGSRRRASRLRGSCASVAFSSCRQTTSGAAARSHSSRFGSRRTTLLMLKVAIFIEGRYRGTDQLEAIIA